MTVTIGWVDWVISSASNSWIREAWIAAPRAAREEGERAVESVEGDMIEVVGGKSETRREAIRGVWDVPPERMTYDSMAKLGGVIGREKPGTTYLVDVQNV